ncbi:RagB/SusD family nutrient uptake outer membrane protein [Daejeonella oryzae]|uniref:RagB/SusD family nutrient uptake outer membrane protein n=1 Tax=Daejeonella oryzae TaxID=1122943 RepID=UPI00047C39FE|nr:RagB/SusD family nutrient uptake outer membrane protein [Daejeonella oryzae]
MRKIYSLVLGALLLSATSCEKFLDVNTNPNAPQTVSANLYLSPMLHWMVTSPQYEGRQIGRYTQNWYLPGTSISTWDRMGYDPSTDNGAQQWRDVYWTLGQNLVDMNTLAEAEQRWDLLGVGQILKAWGWQVLTDTHGEIIVKEAIDQTKLTFNYDSQEYAYLEVQKLLTAAIANLQRTDGSVDQAYLARTDKIYNGDRAKWTKLAYGMLALNLNHYSNKASYNPAEIIAAVDKSFASNADDPLLTYPNSQNDDINFWGRTRGNIHNYRQTQFIVNLMNGTQFGGVVDPRMSRTLAPSPDGLYRGLDINVAGNGALAAAQIPNNFHGYPGTGGLQSPGRYLFDDKAKMPLMTYSQLQFIKAEAAYKMGDKATALIAYRNAISSHIDFVNARNLDNSQSPTQISAADKAAFLASPAIVPATAEELTLSQIMSQKYIAQWGWGHNETWMDLRRYHYTDTDPVTGNKVFLGFTPPVDLYPDNGGKVVERIRPRYNSEYVWNRPGLDAIGGLALDYHTKPLWITQP